MQFIITDAGLDAAQRARDTGWKLVINKFAVSLDDSVEEGTAPYLTKASRELPGEIQFKGHISGFEIEDINNVVYLCVLDESVGDFRYNAIGLYFTDPNGVDVLFAAHASYRKQWKKKTSAYEGGATIIIEAKSTLTTLAAIVSFPIYDVTWAKLVELKTVNLLRPPIASDTNGYICYSYDPYNQTIPALKAADFRWSFPTYFRVVCGQVTGNGKRY